MKAHTTPNGAVRERPSKKRPTRRKNDPSVSRPDFRVVSSELRGLPVALGHWQPEELTFYYPEVLQPN